MLSFVHPNKMCNDIFPSLVHFRETSLQQKILTLERSVEFERQKSRLEGHEPRPVSPTASNRFV